MIFLATALALAGGGAAALWLGTPPTALVDTVAPLVERARDLLHTDRGPLAEPPGAPATSPTTRTIVWATEGGELLRAEVPVAAHDAFVAALRETQAKDLDRLSQMAEKRLTRETQTILDDTAARIPGFVDAVASARVATVNSVFASLGGSPADPAEVIADKALRRAGALYAEQFRQDVLRPAQSVPALRATAGQVIAAVRKDLIGSCDGYDQAFRVFLRGNVSAVEALTPDGQWVGLPWAAGSGTFRSLCHTLRAARADESMFDEATVRGIGEPTMTVHDSLRDLGLPVARVVTAMMLSYNGVVGTLTGWGLPAGIATFPATAWSYGAASPVLASQFFSPTLDSEPRGQIIAALVRATREGQAEVVRGLHETLVTYIGGELTAMATAVTARIDRSRRAPG